MGYKAKPWPAIANQHRSEAIFKAAKIRNLAREMKKAGDVYANPDLAAAKIEHIITLAQVIVDVLESAPSDEGRNDKTG